MKKFKTKNASLYNTGRAIAPLLYWFNEWINKKVTRFFEILYKPSKIPPLAI
jgi:hypothetical protein